MDELCQNDLSTPVLVGYVASSKLAIPPYHTARYSHKHLIESKHNNPLNTNTVLSVACPNTRSSYQRQPII